MEPSTPWPFLEHGATRFCTSGPTTDWAKGGSAEGPCPVDWTLAKERRTRGLPRWSDGQEQDSEETGK